MALAFSSLGTFEQKHVLAPAFSLKANKQLRAHSYMALQVGFEELSAYALSHPDPIEELPSGSVERYEIIQHQVLTAAS